MAKTVYIKTALTGGGATALDGIDGDSLLDGDVAFVFVSGLHYVYELDDDLDIAESSPTYIRPDTNTGTKDWVLRDVYATAGRILQTVATTVVTSTTGSTVIPLDDTIPQNNEGDEYMTLSITPKSATSKLVIEASIHLANSSDTGTFLIAALFQDDTANALTATLERVTANINNSRVACLNMRHVMISGTTSATTFKVRGGGNTAGTTTFNGYVGSRLLGGVLSSSIKITEIAQ